MFVIATLDGDERQIPNADALRMVLADSGLCEVWIAPDDAGPRICALMNGNDGWLMYLAEPGDSGSSSRNPEYLGPPDAVIQYRLSNGQVDEYPAMWAFPRDVICAALLEFATDKRRPTRITWHED